MKRFLILGAMWMAAVAVLPVAVMAQDHRGEKRYYDRQHHDYHYWNEGEDRNYRAYLVERHEAYVPFVQVNRRRRQEYFTYRHDHGFKVEVR